MDATLTDLVDRVDLMIDARDLDARWRAVTAERVRELRAAWVVHHVSSDGDGGLHHDLAEAEPRVSPLVRRLRDESMRCSHRVPRASRRLVSGAAVAAAVGAVAAAFVWIRTGRDALFFQGRGLFDLPKAYLGIALLSVPFALGTLALMRRVGLPRARVTVAVALAAVVAAFAPLARPGGGPLMTTFFMVVPLSFGVLFSLTWLLATDLFEDLDLARQTEAYGVVGASAIAGGVVAGGAGRLLAEVFEPRQFLLLGSATLIVAAATMAQAQARLRRPRRLPIPGPAATASAAEVPVPLRRLWREPYPVLLLAVGMATAVVGVLVEFQFYLVAATSGHDGRANTRFFANMYLVLNAAALVVQIAVLPRLQPRFGVHRSLLVLPTVLVVGAVALLGSTTVSLGSLLRVAEGGLKASIHRVSWEQAYLPVAAARRAAVKVLVDGAGARVAEGLAALLLLGWLELVVRGGSLVGRDIRWLTYALAAASVASVALTTGLARRLRSALAAAGPLSSGVPLPDCSVTTATLGEGIRKESAATHA